MAKKKRVRETWMAQVYLRPLQTGKGECEYHPAIRCFVSKKLKADDIVRITVELLERKERKHGR